MRKITTLIICLTFAEITSAQDINSTILNTLSRKQFEIGFEMYFYTYKEPGYMKDEGIFYGITGAYTYRAWIPSSTKNNISNKKWMLRFETRAAYGTVDYDGALMDGTPYTIADISDRALETRLLVGNDFLKKTSMNTPYMGIGYRYLNDDSSFDPAGYERESNYIYIPFGLKNINDLRNGWFFEATIEFDLFLWGEQRTDFMVFGLLNVKNRQDTGYGLRGSIRFQKRSKDIDLAIEPYIRYWEIGKSDIQYIGGEPFFEPENKTTECGIMFIGRF